MGRNQITRKRGLKTQRPEDPEAKLWFLIRQDGVTFGVQDDMTDFFLDERPGKRRTGKFVDLVTGVLFLLGSGYDYWLYLIKLRTH